MCILNGRVGYPVDRSNITVCSRVLYVKVIYVVSYSLDDGFELLSCVMVTVYWVVLCYKGYFKIQRYVVVVKK